MIYSIVLLAASAAAVAAQGTTYNPTTGVYSCPLNPNGAYCASSSLGSPIILRCTNGIAQPGNCNDNLAGYYPYGSNDALCWETSDTSGDAACEKNCIVEGSSGNYNGTFTLPGCTPAVPSTSSTTSPSSTAVSVSTNPSTPTTTSTAESSSTTITSTGTTTYTNGGTTITEIFTTTTVVCPTTSSTLLTSTVVPLLTSTTMPLSTESSSSISNGTVTSTFQAAGSSLATATPVGPTSTSPPLAVVTGSAITNSAGAGLAAVGLLIACLL